MFFFYYSIYSSVHCLHLCCYEHNVLTDAFFQPSLVSVYFYSYIFQTSDFIFVAINIRDNELFCFLLLSEMLTQTFYYSIFRLLSSFLLFFKSIQSFSSKILRFSLFNISVQIIIFVGFSSSF